MIVGLTGGIGSGKSTILSFFSAFKNVAVYMADKEAKKLMLSVAIKNKIIHEFGAISYANNKLNRKFIADIVFKDEDKLKTLNTIVHPAVQQHFQEFIKKNKNKDYIVYENAILFENGNDIFCDVIICVTSPLRLRIERIIKRDGVTKEEVLQRIKNQWKESKKIIQSNYIIPNYTKENSLKEVNRIHKILTLNTA